MSKMRSVNLFVLGTQKCGTTSLADYLSTHQEIFVPSVKEMYHFCVDQSYLKGNEWYENEFFAPAAAEAARYRVDATPFYLASEEALQRIAAYCEPQTRFLVILRDPVARAVSAYRHQLRLGNEELSLEDALDAEPERIARARTAGERWWRHAYVSVGKYGEQLERAFDLLGRDRILVMPGHALQDTSALNRTLVDFLDLSMPFEAREAPRSNQASMPRSAFLRNLIIRQNPIKSLAQSILPRELRSRIGRAINSGNAKPAEKFEVSEETRARLRQAFVEDLAHLRRLDPGAGEYGFSFQGSFLDVSR